MNKSRLIWGIICLALAALLSVLNVTLPADKLMFTVEGKNMPWVPVAILGIIGLALLLTAVGRTQKAVQEAQPRTVDEEKEP